MELEALLSFVRYQRGQKAGWDALDEVLTAVSESNKLVADAEARVKALDKELAEKEAKSLQADKDLEAKYEYQLEEEANHQAKLDALEAQASHDIDAKIAAKKADLDRINAAHAAALAALAGAQHELDAMREEQAQVSKQLVSIKSQLAEIKAVL